MATDLTFGTEIIVSCLDCGDQVTIRVRDDHSWSEERITFPRKCEALRDRFLQTPPTNFICPHMHKAVSEAAANHRKQ